MNSPRPLRDYFHDLLNKIQGIAVSAGGFAYLYGHYPEKIKHSTREKLSEVLEDIELYCEKTYEDLSSTARAIDKSIASEEWASVQKAVGKELSDIYKLLDDIKDLSAKIHEADYKDDILNITKEMDRFQGKCEAAAKIIECFKERLVSLGIYDNVCG